jgi:hypothetical protein
VAEAIDTTKEAPPAQGFQTLDSKDLGDLESSVSTRAATPQGGPAETPGSGPAASAEVTATHLPDASAGTQTAAPVLKEVPAALCKRTQTKSDRTRKAIKAACGSLLVLALALGIWRYARYPHPAPPDIQPRTAAEEVADVLEKPSSDSNRAAPAGDDHFLWEAKLREIDSLRQTLLAKKEEILALQQNYQYGILELEEEAARLIRRGSFDSLSHGLKNRRIELALQSIQRRCSYRDNLERPLRWIDLGSEELLYLRRRALFDLQLKDIAEHIDMAAHMADIDSALMRYQPTAENLSINCPAPLQPSLEVLWRRLAEQSRHVETSAEDQQNQDIIAEVCSGNLGRLSELSSLTLRGARCLAESGAMQLFLNRLNGMTPVAARKLCEWPGQWLCLNGVTRLTPELASQLFAWPGEWMSLNGVSEVPDEAARHLAKWDGRQLELMGLRKSTGIKFLAQWEASGGRLVVPAGIRREIELYRHTGQSPAQVQRRGRP